MQKANTMHAYKATMVCLNRRLALAKGGETKLCLPDEGLSAMLVVCAMETKDIHLPRSVVHPSLRAAVRAVIPDLALWAEPNADSHLMVRPTPLNLHRVARKIKLSLTERRRRVQRLSRRRRPTGEPAHYRDSIFTKIPRCAVDFPCCAFEGEHPSRARTCWSWWCQTNDGCS